MAVSIRERLATQWAWSSLAILSQSLDDANVPQVSWGDHVLGLYSVPTALNTSGFIIHQSDLPAAVRAIEGIGLEQCHCKDLLHASDPDPNSPSGSLYCKTHFYLERQKAIIYIATSEDEFNNIVPITDTDPNPLGLKFDILHALLDDPKGPSIPLVGSRGPEDRSVHPLRVPKLPSLLSILLYLSGMRCDLPRKGLVLPWMLFISYILAYTDNDPQNPLVDSLEDPGLSLIYDSLHSLSEQSFEDIVAAAWKVTLLPASLRCNPKENMAQSQLSQAQEQKVDI